jgi:hypothetical protein
MRSPLFLLAHLLERCRFRRPVNRDQIVLVMHFLSCRDLHELACKEGDPGPARFLRRGLFLSAVGQGPKIDGGARVAVEHR